jgi:hypothetical protein
VRARSIPALLALLTVIVAGCGGSAIEPTGVRGTSPAQRSASSHPSPSPSPSKFDTPPLDARGWEGVVVRTVCLDLDLSHWSPEVTSAIEKGIERTLSQLGIATVAAGGSCEATLSVALRGGALGADYGRAGWCYPGVQLSGTVTFEGGGRPAIQSAVDLKIGTPLVITSCPSAQSTLCRSAAHQVFDRVVNLWDSSVMAPKPSPTKWSALDPDWGPHPSPLVGGRTDSIDYMTWCAFPSTATSGSG